MRLSDFEISIYDNLADIETLWRAAEPQLAVFPFQTYDWLAAWADVTTTSTPQIAVVRGQGGEIALILPLCIQRRHGLRLLTIMAADVSDYHAPLVSPSFAQSGALTDFPALFDAILARIAPFDYLQIRWMPPKVQDLDNPLAKLSGATPSIKAYRSALPATFGEFLNRKRKKIHHDTERQIRRLGEHGEVRIHRVKGATQILAITALMLEQKARRFMGFTGEPASFRNARALAFYSKIGAIDGPEGCGHVSCLEVGGEAVATHVGFEHRKTFYYIMPGFETTRWGRFSPGRVLMEHLIRESIEGGVTTFDMTIGDERYKKDWISHETQLFELIRGASFKGKLFCAGRALARRLRTHLKAALKRNSS